MNGGNRWEQELYISQGGFSEVYRVKQNGKYYALKKIFPSVLKKPALKESIMREIKIMESLDHPKIIKLYQVIVEEDEISLLLQYAEGGSVHDQLKNYGKLPEHQVKQYVKDLVQALEYLHNKNNPILHRDIKPQNLLIGEDHHCRLADFGSANVLEGIRTSYVGTECYMAPEVIERQPHGVPYDVWCVGILIYELLTGEVWTEKQVYPAYLSRASQDVIKKLLVKDQSKRMTLKELRQHIWLCDDNKRVRKMSSSKRVNKLDELEKRVKGQLKAKIEEWKNFESEDHAFKKEKSTLQENKELNLKSDEYIQLIKEREKLKEQIMKNDKIIEQEDRRRRTERPYLLQEIDRLKCLIRQYENNINILKGRPLRKEAQSRNHIYHLGKRIEDLTQYVKKLPERVKYDILYFSDYESEVQILPIREHILKMETETMILRRDALIELITAKKTHRQIQEMIEIHNEFHMSEYISEKEVNSEKGEEVVQSSYDLLGAKEKIL